MLKSVNVNEKSGEVTIVMTLDKSPQPSKSGKTLIASSTHGLVRTQENYKGKPLTLSINAMIPNA